MTTPAAIVAGIARALAGDVTDVSYDAAAGAVTVTVRAPVPAIRINVVATNAPRPSPPAPPARLAYRAGLTAWSMRLAELHRAA